uniref:Aquaporin 11 n=1 Tax=Eptatretus burgeri TaxID=7764 RepID=A0A8C4QYQ3_EPTBU
MVLAGSLLALALTVSTCEALRRCSRRLLPGAVHSLLAAELLSTLQLCACTYELRLLGEGGVLTPRFALTLSFAVTLVHGLTLEGCCSPCGALELQYGASEASRDSAARVLAQFVGAVLSGRCAAAFWALGLSPLHAAAPASYLGSGCRSPLRASAALGTAAEALCAFAFHVALLGSRRAQRSLAVPFVSATITALVFAAGGLTGAVFNPTLAFALTFGCPPHNLLTYVQVYWLGPVIGMTAAYILYHRNLPFRRAHLKIH